MEFPFIALLNTLNYRSENAPNNLLHRSALVGLVLGRRGLSARPVNMAIMAIVVLWALYQALRAERD